MGAAGGEIVNSKGKIEHAGVVIGIGKDKAAGLIHNGFDSKYIGYMGKLCYIQNVSALVGDLLAVRKSVFEEAGGFPEDYKCAFSDVSLCLKLKRLGYLNVFNPYAKGVSDKPQLLLGSDDSDYQSDLNKFKEEFTEELNVCDPYYNPNLTKETLDYSIC